MAVAKSESRRRSLKQAASRTGAPAAEGGALTSADAQRQPRYTAGGDAGAPPVSLRGGRGGGGGGGARREEGGGRDRAARAPSPGGQTGTAAGSAGASEAARRPEEAVRPSGETTTPAASARGYASAAGGGASPAGLEAPEQRGGEETYASTSPTELRERGEAEGGGEYKRSVDIVPQSQGEAAKGTPVAGAPAVEPSEPPVAQPGAAESADAALKASASFDPTALELPADALEARPGEEVAAAEDVSEAVSTEAVEGAVEGEGGEGEEGGEGSAEGGDAAAGGGEGGGGGGGGDDASAGIGKEEAVARAAEAVGRLADSYSTVASLRGTTVSFAKHKGEAELERSASQNARQQRSAAEALANGFLNANADKVQTILAVAESVPVRLLAAADAAKAAIDASVEENRSMLAAQIAATRAGAYASADAARAQVTAAHASAVAAITAATLAAQERVTAAHTSALTTLDTREAAQVSRIHALYSEGDRKFRAAGPAAGDAAVARAAERKQTYLSQRNGESDILDGPIHDNRLEASADAAVQVGDGYKKSLIEEANKQADESQKGKQKDLDNVSTQATSARTALEQQLTASRDALSQAETQALAGADQALDGMLQGIDSGLNGVLAALGQQESSQLEALSQFGARQKEAIDRDASTAVASLVDSVNAAAETLNKALADFVAAARTSQPPDTATLQKFLTGAQGQIDSLSAELFDGLEQGMAASEQGVATGGETSVESIGTLGQSGVEQALSGGADFAAAMGALSQQAAQTFSGLQTSHTQTAETGATTAEAGFKAVTEGIQTLFDQINTGLESGFTQASAEFEKGLKGYVKEHIDQAIDEKAKEAADQVQPRWKSVLKILLVIVVVIVVALVVGPAVIGFVGGLAASAIGAGTAATVIGAAVGGAIVGAASGAVIQLGNNVIDGKENLLEGVGKAAIVGAISGAIGGFGGAWAGTLFKGAGAIGQTVGRGAISLVFDTGGGVLGDLAVGNPVTLEGVLVGAAIGIGVSAAASGLSKIGRIGDIQRGAMAMGESAGMAVGTSIKGAAGVHVGAPSAGAVAAPDVSVKTEPEVTTSKPGGAPEGADVAPTATPPPEADVAPPRTDTPEPDAPTPAKADTPEPDAPQPKPEGQPATEPPQQKTTHEGEPQVEEGVVAKASDADGHDVKVTEEGNVVRCSECDITQGRPGAKENPELQQKANEVAAEPDPQTKANEGAELNNEITQNEQAQQGKAVSEAEGPSTPPRDENGGTPQHDDTPPDPLKKGAGGDETTGPRADADEPSGVKTDEPEPPQQKGPGDETPEGGTPQSKPEGEGPQTKPTEEGPQTKPATEEPAAPKAPDEPATGGEPHKPARNDGNGPVDNPNPGRGKGQVPCFPAGTPVSTPSGPRAIETLREGDEVFSYEFDTGEVVARRVLDAYEGETHYWVDVRLGDSVLRATREHPVWVVSEQEWVVAQALEAGMTVLLQGGGTAVVTGVETIGQSRAKETFNLTIEDSNNFFAGDLRVLVHNATQPTGHSVYVLIGPDGKIYYVGRFGPNQNQQKVEYRHGKNHNRFDPNVDKMVVLRDGDLTYAEARRLEHELCVREKTYIGADGDNYRGNRDYPMSEKKMDKYYGPEAC